MVFYSRRMTREHALNILSWKYDPPYDLYNNEVTEESISELIKDGYIAVVDETGDLYGFYCSGESAQVPLGSNLGLYNEEAIDVGVGMHPGLTGKGYGLLFFSFVLTELERVNSNPIFRLTVAAFNKRAIKLYKNLGFIEKETFKTETNEFIVMLKR